MYLFMASSLRKGSTKMCPSNKDNPLPPPLSTPPLHTHTNTYTQTNTKIDNEFKYISN